MPKKSHRTWSAVDNLRVLSPMAVWSVLIGLVSISVRLTIIAAVLFLGRHNENTN